jgi:hypothetical protein
VSKGIEIDLTVFRSKKRLTKRYERGGQGELVKTSGVQFGAGTADRTTLRGATPAQVLDELGALIANLDSRQAIGLGVANNGQARNAITTKELFAEFPSGEAMPRGKAFFSLPKQSPCLVFGDGDMGSGSRAKLIQIDPAFADVAMLVRPSASASIVDTVTGERLPGGGEHCYFLASRADRYKEILTAIRRLTLKHGLARLRLAKKRSPPGRRAVRHHHLGARAADLRGRARGRRAAQV